VEPDPTGWDEHLGCAEFAINNSWQEALISLWTKKGLQGGKTIQQRSGFALLWSLMLLPVLWLMPLRSLRTCMYVY